MKIFEIGKPSRGGSVKEIIFVFGGCRSGKCRYALELAEQVPGQNKIFITPCIPHDKEMESIVGILRRFSGVVSMEVFSYNHLKASLEFLEKCWQTL